MKRLLDTAIAESLALLPKLAAAVLPACLIDGVWTGTPVTPGAAFGLFFIWALVLGIWLLVTDRETVPSAQAVSA